jgi:hypothetical protein
MLVSEKGPNVGIDHKTFEADACLLSTAVLRVRIGFNVPLLG